ncbi:ras-GEF domain-containing family member 1B-like isoform X3 [Onthophagus taurus]|uniref:ras-GEF domain-containing family member 1B-like isoform X3 n=1 Tax=Onthophagus taurus TaxID=166361 RepID=UPI000C20E8C9|nr:ras-GEF domain-containing family member 1B-like isoform X3 [Onthophagus taurus]
MDDPEIQETVESILGKGVKVVDCEKKSSIKEEEMLFINGIPVTLEGKDGFAIKQALMTGQVPPCDLLNTLLIKTGILKAPVKLDTTLSVKSTTVTKEEVIVSRDGKIVDERNRETKEHNFYTSEVSEVFEPVKILPTAELINYQKNGDQHDHYSDDYMTESERKFSSSCSSDSSFQSDSQKHLRPGNPSKDSGIPSTSVSTTKIGLAPSLDSLSSLDEVDYKNDVFGYTHNDTHNGYRKSSMNLPQGSHTKHSYSNGDVHKSMTKDQQQNGLVHRDDNLVSGSLDSLILHMVPTNVYYPDKAYIFAFLLSSRLYIKPHDLLDRIRSISESQQNARSSAGSENHGCTKFAENLVKLLEEWTQTFPYDFRDERVMQYVRTFTQYCCTLNSSLRANVSNLLHNLLQKLTALEAYDKSVETPMVSIEGLPGDITELCPNPGVLAQQLTHIELERLSFIGPEEFVQAFAKENLFLENAFRDMKKTRNLEHYVQWFNRLSYFVATQVCKCPKKKQRVKVVEYWVEVGGECLNIGNFNSLMGIIAGLNMSPIARLKKTWSKIQSGKFAILEHQMDPSNNFSSYRSTLKAAMWRSEGATDQQQKIVIPFFSLLVKDLYFLNQGCSNKLPNGHINFEKFWQLAKQVTEFMVWKQIECPFEKDPKVLSMLLHGPVHNENALALASFECEPPDNSQDKERCKSLKVDGITN